MTAPDFIVAIATFKRWGMLLVSPSTQPLLASRLSLVDLAPPFSGSTSAPTRASVYDSANG
ncbi:MAG: hypothetical protein LRZ84_19695 [Desertifilum sp.]|uniref:Uncharacterized protein n=1 Tax=Geitlerinema calcuttense NRMC-F 0142 TaxID=2922238 RepID=A0ABT7LZW1_9CYAN|nr:hypothetical protein [Desertifilum sp.]MDL5057551.1 hypothetical protein [Geitlerinema calcuttense NRMC-F 0142]